MRRHPLHYISSYYVPRDCRDIHRGTVGSRYKKCPRDRLEASCSAEFKSGGFLNERVLMSAGFLYRDFPVCSKITADCNPLATVP